MTGERRAPGSLMREEMLQQPGVLEGLVARREGLVGSLRSRLPDSPAGVVLVARGSSDNAAVYGRYLLELVAGRPAGLAAPSLYTRYGLPPRLAGYLAVGISQSGRTPEVAEVLEAMGRAGAVTVAITNRRDSPLGEAAAVVVELEASEERAIPATKTFTAQVAALAVMAEALGDPPWAPSDWEVTLAAMSEALADWGPVEEAAGRVARAERLAVVGRGFLYPVALEAALKVSETAEILATGYSPADLLHGPIAAAGSGLEALCFAAPGPVLDDVCRVARLLAERGAGVAVVGELGVHVPTARLSVGVPEGVPEALAPLVHVVRAQQLALEAALRRGLDPDRPAGLSKVTPTT